VVDGLLSRGHPIVSIQKIHDTVEQGSSVNKERPFCSVFRTIGRGMVQSRFEILFVMHAALPRCDNRATRQNRFCWSYLSGRRKFSVESRRVARYENRSRSISKWCKVNIIPVGASRVFTMVDRSHVENPLRLDSEGWIENVTNLKTDFDGRKLRPQIK
jgi:hypothetical protein